MAKIPRFVQMLIQMQGLDAKEIRVIALPNSILLQAEPKSREPSTPIDPGQSNSEAR